MIRFYSETTSGWLLAQHNERSRSLKVTKGSEKILRCPVCYRWAWSNICCCPWRGQWTPEARRDCGRPGHRNHKHWGSDTLSQQHLNDIDLSMTTSQKNVWHHPENSRAGMCSFAIFCAGKNSLQATAWRKQKTKQGEQTCSVTDSEIVTCPQLAQRPWSKQYMNKICR